MMPTRKPPAPHGSVDPAIEQLAALSSAIAEDALRQLDALDAGTAKPPAPSSEENETG